MGPKGQTGDSGEANRPDEVNIRGEKSFQGAARRGTPPHVSLGSSTQNSGVGGYGSAGVCAGEPGRALKLEGTESGREFCTPGVKAIAE